MGRDPRQLVSWALSYSLNLLAGTEYPEYYSLTSGKSLK